MADETKENNAKNPIADLEKEVLGIFDPQTETKKSKKRKHKSSSSESGSDEERDTKKKRKLPTAKNRSRKEFNRKNQNNKVLARVLNLRVN